MEPGGFFRRVSSHGIHALVSVSLPPQQPAPSVRRQVYPFKLHFRVSPKGSFSLPHSEFKILSKLVG